MKEAMKTWRIGIAEGEGEGVVLAMTIQRQRMEWSNEISRESKRKSDSATQARGRSPEPLY
jgi:hypothetical protein